MRIIPVIYIIAIIIQTSIQSLAQAPLVKMWDKRFGGTGDEGFYSLQQTADGGYIFGGMSLSGIGGDKTQPNWDTVHTGNFISSDFWVVKIDSIGNKQWDKRFGGTIGEELYALKQTFDGGYILGGWSDSDSSGDKTQPSRKISGSSNTIDYWIVKIDSSGNKQWDKRFGGSGTDKLTSLEQTDDGGYILGGSSNSLNDGDKTQSPWFPGVTDYWIVKTDAHGNKEWDKRFGNCYSQDELMAVRQTKDGGYILGGWMHGEDGCDVTQPSWAWSMVDFWIVKVDSAGNKQWDKRIGGVDDDVFRSLVLTDDGGYMLHGISESGADGDKTESSRGYSDYWIVKIDSLGIKQWDRRYGGIYNEEVGTVAMDGNISHTCDGGYLITGISISPVSGDKSENNLGLWQTWLVKIDSAGNKQWDKTLFALTPDAANIYSRGIQARDGCYIIASLTEGGIGGHVTQPNRDTTENTGDFWIVKLCDTTLQCVPSFQCNLSPPNLVANQTAFCANDSAQICTGADYATYSWNNGQTSRCITTSLAGNFNATVTDIYGCSAVSNPVSINVYPLPSISITVNDDTLNASDAVTYQWYLNGTLINGATSGTHIANENGSYIVAIADSNGCHVNSSEVVISGICNSLTVTTNSVTAHVTCLGASDGAAKAIVSGGTSPYSFLWSDGQTTSTPTGFPAGTYSVTVSDNNSCTATTSITIAEGPICTGVQEYLLDNISLYPNPTDGSVTLQMSSLQEMTSVHLKLYDALGRQVMDQRVESAMIQLGITIDLKNLPGNIFFLYITTEAGSRVMKVVKY